VKTLVQSFRMVSASVPASTKGGFLLLSIMFAAQPRRLCTWCACLLLVGVPGIHAETNQIAAVIAALKTSPYSPSLLANLKISLATLENRGDRCAPGVIYCLGCLANGQTAEGTTTRDQILKAFGGDPSVDAVADENITDPCTGAIAALSRSNARDATAPNPASASLATGPA